MCMVYGGTGNQAEMPAISSLLHMQLLIMELWFYSIREIDATSLSECDLIDG